MKRDKKIEEINGKLVTEIISKADKTITRISIIAKKTPRYIGMYEELRVKFSKISSLSKEANSNFENLIANKYSMKSKEFYYDVKLLEFSIASINKLELDFKKLTESVTQQEKFLSSEFLYYSSNLREVIQIYKTKRIAIDSISSKIDELASKIKAKGRKFNEYITSAENFLASKVLNEYSTLVIKFSIIISEAPTIDVYINKTIKKVIGKISTLYVKKKEELNAPMGHIDFKEAIIKISEVYKNAKDKYHNLEFNSCKKDIISILKSAKTLERLINYEIKSRNFFIKNHPIIKSEILKTIKNYESIKKNIRAIVERGEIIPKSLTSPINNAEKIKNNILKSIKYLKDVSKVNKIPYSSKLSRLKSLCNKTNELIKTLNDTIKSLWEQNFESANVMNKYKKSDAAINELLANINLKTIILKPKKESLLKTMETQLNNIALKISSANIDDDMRTAVNIVEENTIKLYTSIMGDIIIADMTSNLIKDVAPQRALDASLNFSLNKAEREYIDGRYSESLNIIISELERKK